MTQTPGDANSPYQRQLPPQPATPPSAGPAPAGGPAPDGSAPQQNAAPEQGPYSRWNTTQPLQVPEASPLSPAVTAAPKDPKKRFGAGTLAAGVLIAALVGGGAGAGTQLLLDDGQPQAGVQQTLKSDSIIVNNTESVTAITAAAAKASPSVVTISVASGNSGGSGSGIILDAEGHILTNTHVVTLGGVAADPDVTVRTSDGKVHDAEVVGTDPLSDLAVIKINAEGLTAASLADSDKLNVGDTAVAIGAPLGLSGTVTDGIISTVNRTISVASSAVPEESTDTPRNGNGDGFSFQFPNQSQQSSQGSIYINVIQTDAAINHGNSGGALTNSQGEIIGVNVAIASSGSSTGADSESGSIGVGFAIPINYAQRVAQDIIADGSASHGYLGVSVQPKAGGSSAGSTFTVGAEVASVVGGSPAAGAGLSEGDVITGFGERKIEDSQSLTAAVREYSAGSTATVYFQRNGREQTAEVTVGDSASQQR